MTSTITLAKLLNLTAILGEETAKEFPPIPAEWTVNQVLDLFHAATRMEQSSGAYDDMTAVDQGVFGDAASLFLNAHTILKGRFGEIGANRTRCFDAIASIIATLRTRPQERGVFGEAEAIIRAVEWGNVVAVAEDGRLAREQIRHHVDQLVPALYSESELARSIGVDRMTVRRWLGKR